MRIKLNTIKFIIVVSIALLSTDLIYHQVVNGFVDGNNNGKDDVAETWYNLDVNATLGQSEFNCNLWNGTWDGHRCKGLPNNLTSVFNITG